MLLSRSARRFVLAAFVMLFAACGTDGPLDPSRQPVLPPAGAFHPDFAFFRNTTPGSGGTTTAWSAAVQRVDAADAEMSPLLAVPFAALSDAATGSPTRSGGLWRWPVDFDLDGDPYSGELRSSVAGGNYGWDLILTAPAHSPPLSNYLWVTGFSGSTGQEGIWYLADADAGTDQLLAAVSWSLNAQNEASFLFSATDSTIWAYQRNAGTVTLSYLVHNQPRHVTEWRPATGTGSTWSATDDLTRCWNTTQQDVACP